MFLCQGDSQILRKITVFTKMIPHLVLPDTNLTKTSYIAPAPGTPNGVTRVYPAHHLPEYRYTYRGSREYFDPRERHWFVFISNSLLFISNSLFFISNSLSFISNSLSFISNSLLFISNSLLFISNSLSFYQ